MVRNKVNGCPNHKGGLRRWVECFVDGCLIRGKHQHCEDKHNCLSIKQG